MAALTRRGEAVALAGPLSNNALKADGHAACLRKRRARGLRQRYPDEKNQADHVRLGWEEGALRDRRNGARCGARGRQGERMADPASRTPLCRRTPTLVCRFQPAVREFPLSSEARAVAPRLTWISCEGPKTDPAKAG
jgi:hypothetical protein